MHSRATGSEIGGAVALHVIAGIAWVFASLRMWVGRYLFCSDGGSLGPLLVLMIVMWIVSVFVIAHIRARGHRTWPWTLAWFLLSLTIFATAVYNGSEPTDCGFGSGW